MRKLRQVVVLLLGVLGALTLVALVGGASEYGPGHLAVWGRALFAAAATVLAAGAMLLARRVVDRLRWPGVRNVLHWGAIFAVVVLLPAAWMLGFILFSPVHMQVVGWVAREEPIGADRRYVLVSSSGNWEARRVAPGAVALPAEAGGSEPVTAAAFVGRRATCHQGSERIASGTIERVYGQRDATDHVVIRDGHPMPTWFSPPVHCPIDRVTFSGAEGLPTAETPTR